MIRTNAGAGLGAQEGTKAQQYEYRPEVVPCFHYCDCTTLQLPRKQTTPRRYLIGMAPASKVPDVTRISLSEIKELAAAAGPCVSLLIPAENGPVRLKHAIETARQLLEAKGKETRPFLEHIQAISGELTWSSQSVAIYCSAALCRTFELAFPVTESVTVGEHFYVKPIIPLLDADRPFYILALSQKHIRLLRCTSNSAEEVALPESTPTSLWDDKQSDQPDHQQENRSSAGPDQGAMKGVLSSTNTDSEKHEEYLSHFYKHVSEGVAELLKTERSPVVMAGVDYETALFRRVNIYPVLVEDCVHGSADGLKGGELHKRAIEAMQSYWQGPLKAALARYEHSAGSDRGSSTIKEIVAASFDGRVLDLVIAETAQYLGSFDEATHVVKGSKQPEDIDEDLLNTAALQTLMHGGQVYVVPASQVPNGAPAIAVFRW